MKGILLENPAIMALFTLSRMVGGSYCITTVSHIEVFPSAIKDVLAITSLEADLSSIESGTTEIIVKWCGVYKIADHLLCYRNFICFHHSAILCPCKTIDNSCQSFLWAQYFMFVLICNCNLLLVAVFRIRWQTVREHFVFNLLVYDGNS